MPDFMSRKVENLKSLMKQNRRVNSPEMSTSVSGVLNVLLHIKLNILGF